MRQACVNDVPAEVTELSSCVSDDSSPVEWARADSFPPVGGSPRKSRQPSTHSCNHGVDRVPSVDVAAALLVDGLGEELAVVHGPGLLSLRPHAACPVAARALLSAPPPSSPAKLKRATLALTLLWVWLRLFLLALESGNNMGRATSVGHKKADVHQ